MKKKFVNEPMNLEKKDTNKFNKNKEKGVSATKKIWESSKLGTYRRSK